MKYKIHIATEDGELLDTIEIDATELNWDSFPTKCDMANEIIDEIYRDIKRRKNI